jgi:Toprim-like
MIDDRPVLSLAELEAYDPRAPFRGGKERRFCCPLPACADKRIDAAHRSLTLNVETGAWHCWRCGGAGKVQERWAMAPLRPVQRRQRSAAAARRAFALKPLSSAPSPTAVPEPAALSSKLSSQRLAALNGSVGAAYLQQRGIAADLAERAGVRWAATWYGRPAVVFPLRDSAGQLVAMQGRHVDGRTDPKAHDLGPKGAGVFATPGAFEASTVIIVEGPICALSLAAAGKSAIALCGTSAPAWLIKKLAFRRAAVAFDADAAGDAAAPRLIGELRSFGAQVERWRPTGVKDWNDLLLLHGAEVLGRDLAEDQTDDVVEQPVRLANEPETTDNAAPSAAAQHDKGDQGLAMRPSVDPSAIEIRDPVTGEWIELEASSCPPAWRTVAARPTYQREMWDLPP